MKYYDKLENKSTKKSFLQNEEVIDANAEIIKTLSSLNNKELEILRYINKSLLNFIIASDTTKSLVMDNFANKDLFKIILDKRNEVLSNEIIHSSHQKIYITY
jgi:archaellum component FlaF (FlaF/FlaG flagellin family)